MCIRDRPERFHARYNAKGKKYSYYVWNETSPTVFERNHSFYFPQTLDLAKMKEACQKLEGTHDFIGFYGVCDCIFTGLFSVDTNESSWNLSTWVHNIGSGIGYAGFLLFPLIVFLIYRTMGNTQFSQLFLGLTIISFLVASGYGLARIPGVNRLPLLNQLGFWQRLSFFFNYLPIGILSILQIKP